MTSNFPKLCLYAIYHSSSGDESGVALKHVPNVREVGVQLRPARPSSTDPNNRILRSCRQAQ